jgi:hypothetical protein
MKGMDRMKNCDDGLTPGVRQPVSLLAGCCADGADRLAKSWLGTIAANAQNPQGLFRATLVPSNSGTLHVAAAKPCSIAVAAIIASRGEHPQGSRCVAHLAARRVRIAKAMQTRRFNAPLVSA